MSDCFECGSFLEGHDYYAHKKLNKNLFIVVAYLEGEGSPRIEDGDNNCSTVAAFGGMRSALSDPGLPPNPMQFLFRTWMEVLPERFGDYTESILPSWEWYEEMMPGELGELAEYVGDAEYPGVLLNLHFVDYGGGNGVKVSVQPYQIGWDRGGGQIGWVRSTPDQVKEVAGGDRDRALEFITESEIPRLNHWANNNVYQMTLIRKGSEGSGLGGIYPEGPDAFRPSTDLLEEYLLGMDLSDDEQRQSDAAIWHFA